MRDPLIFDIPDLLEAYRAEPAEFRAEFGKQTSTAVAAFFQFFSENGLLVTPGKWANVDWLGVILRESELTETGVKLVKRCLGRWEKSLDRRKKNFDDMSLWEKELAKLLAEEALHEKVKT